MIELKPDVCLRVYKSCDGWRPPGRHQTICRKIAKTETDEGNFCDKCYGWLLEDRVYRLNKPKTYRFNRVPNAKFRKQKDPDKWKFLKRKAEELRNRPTVSEVIFERKLKELEIEYIFQYPFLHKKIGGICDFYLEKGNICIEIDGGYHLEEDQQQTDRVKDFIYTKLGKRILRFTNSQATHLSIEQLKELLSSIA